MVPKVFVVALFLCSFSYAQRELRTCLRAMESFGSSYTSPSESTVVRGAVGKKGPKGSIGEKGEKGESSADEERAKINEISRRVSRLEEKLENVTTGLSLIKESLENLTATSTFNRLAIENQNSTEERRVTTCASTGGLLEGNQCFQYVSNAGGETTFAEAERRCQAMNCELAEITSDAMQERVDNHVRATWEFGGSSYNNFWLGSTYQTANHPSKVVTLESGREVRLSKWYPNYPYSSSSWSHMGLSVYKHAASRYNGVLNVPASSSRIPLCACNA